MSIATSSYTHDVYQSHWYDPFELNTTDGKGCMLLDLPGAPCDVTQLSMRTMSQRLRRAADLAEEEDSKYGLLQAVLLSLDSQPANPSQRVREAIALEACSRVLLPAAHEVPLDLDAARAAYQQLDLREQRLWRQLQAARLQLFHIGAMDPSGVEGYLPNEIYIANVLGGVTGDVTALAYEVIRMLLNENRWGLVITLSKRYGLVGNPAAPTSMQAAYNWAVAAYHHHGKDHPETRAAVAAIEAADPQAWVLKLLSGLTFPMLSLASRHVRGNKMEAAEYAHFYGRLWLSSTDRSVDRDPTEVDTYSALLTWLLAARGLTVPTRQQQQDVIGVRLLVVGDAASASTTVEEQVEHARTLLKDATWPACRERLEQWSVPRLLRALVVSAASLAVLTMNLPPLSAAPELWRGVGVQLGYKSFMDMASELEDHALFLVPWINTLVQAYAPRGPPSPAAAAAEARLGFCYPNEVVEFMQVAPYLSVAAARWMWQCGDAAAARQECRMEPGGTLHLLSRGVAVDAATGNMLSSRGLLPSSVAPLNALADFLLQQSALQRPDTGLRKVANARRAAQQRGNAAGEALITKLADPKENLLYSQFEWLLDMLLSQVIGREVMLVIEPAGADDVTTLCTVLTPYLDGIFGCSVYLEDDDTEEQQLFYWSQPGDGDGTAAHKLLMQQAASRGCTEPDLQLYCPAVEPYTAGPAAGGRGVSHAPSSSSRPGGRQQQQQGSMSKPPGGVAAGRAAAGAAAAAPGRRVAQVIVAAQQSRSEGRQPTAAAAVAGPTPGSSGRNPAADAGSSSSRGSSSRVKPSRPCAQCGELFPKLKQCSRCKAVAYCSRDCQLAHWKAGHKEACQEQGAV